MRKLVTLLAALTLAASSLAVAETTTTGNPNDPLQQVAPTGAEPTAAPTTLADADASAPAAASTDTGMDTAKPMMKKHHHKKKPCKKCKHHCKTHHHKKKMATPTPASEHEMQPETTAPASQ